MQTTREDRTAPRAKAKVMDNDLGYDPDLYEHVDVEDKIPGVLVNDRNVSFYKTLGFQVLETNKDAMERITGHEAMTRMVRPKAMGEKYRKDQDARHSTRFDGRDAQGRPTSGDPRKGGMLTLMAPMSVREMKSELESGIGRSSESISGDDPLVSDFRDKRGDISSSDIEP